MKNTRGNTIRLCVTAALIAAIGLSITACQFLIPKDRPVDIPDNAVELTLDTWKDGTIPANGENWYKFTATASTQYIHASFGTLTGLDAQVYDSDGNEVGNEAYLYSPSTHYDGSTGVSYVSQTVTVGNVYYIKVTPASSGNGTYRIGFNALFIAPGNTVADITNKWGEGSLTENGEQWFSFNATTADRYIHAYLGSLKSLDVQLYDSAGATVGGDKTTLNSQKKYISRTVTTGQTYYVKVKPYNGSGTYRIACTATETPPSIIPPPSVTELAADTWADGELPQNGEQWFSFTATATTQYIHASSGTLSSIIVQLYNASGGTVGNEATLSGSSPVSLTVTGGSVYYIKVTPPYYGSGTYKIGFSAKVIPPGVTPTGLTLNTWADGNLPQNGQNWFSFTATATTTQYIHASSGPSSYYFSTIKVQVYNSNSVEVATKELSSFDSYVSLTVTGGSVYYIKVTMASASGNGSTYKITFNTSETPPS